MEKVQERQMKNIEDINKLSVKKILSAKKRMFPVLPTFSIAAVLFIGAILYFDFFNLFGEEI